MCSEKQFYRQPEMTSRLFLSIFGTILLLSKVSEADNDFKKCCDMGTNWASEGLECSKFSGPVPGIPKLQQTICMKAVDLCCLRSHRDKMCEEGKNDARNSANCAEVNSNNVGDSEGHRKACCEGCQLGISVAENKDCSLSFSFGEPLDSAFKECCQNPTLNITTPTSESSTSSISTVSKSSTTENDDLDDIFKDDTENPTDATQGLTLCDIMKGLLCSHTCVPTKGSYYCTCPENHTLLEDMKTCKNNDRCKTDENPCEQFCKDNGETLQCSCNDGFKLTKNNRTCERQTDRPVRTTTVYQNKDPALKCPLGYRFNATANRCDDIDECADNTYICGNEICFNQPGGYICAKAPQPTTGSSQREPLITSTVTYSRNCTAGYKSDNYDNCVDIDECKELEDACDSHEDCINTIGSFVCNCKKGFHRDNLTTACVDINECKTGENDCLDLQRCDNTIGGYTCVRFLPCGTGYTLNAASEICEDDDECSLETHDCAEGYHCKNTLGSYRCVRNRPNSKTTMTNPFTTPTTPRVTRPLTTMRSTTTTTAFTTRKPPTSTTSTQKPTTTTQKSTTTTQKSTTTTQKSTTTTRKSTTTTQRSTTSRPTTMTTTTIGSTTTKDYRIIPMRSCPRGFDLKPSGQCMDVDECTTLAKPCPVGGKCINTFGSYKCQIPMTYRCGNGFTYDARTNRCIDVDECAENTHECDQNQTCQNQQGGYLCVCPTGHTIKDRKCVDIDECSLYSGQICGSYAKCENKIGSYLCHCESGFKNNNGKGTCQDIDECADNPNLCQHMCVNTWGSYRCSCQSGFRLSADNKTCTDIDECKEYGDNNLCIGICDNTPGSYSCVCPRGYRLGSDGRTCQDIDECSTGEPCKDPSEMCQNTRGGFRCNKINCPPGYTLDRQKKNRCVRTTNFCNMNDQKCIRSPSHYSYNFITFVSMIPMPSSGELELFTMRGAHLQTSTIQFTMAFVEARAPPDVIRATESCFALHRKSASQVVLVLTKSIAGPQEIELELNMEIYNNDIFSGSAVAKIFIYVSQYEF